MTAVSPAADSASADLVARVAYNSRYIDDPDAFVERILAKTIVPYQVEAQPGRLGTRALCWMECPYCYGGSSKNTDERLTPERYIEIVKQTAKGPHGSVKKIIYAGYATDPLNYQHIDDLAETSIALGQVVGFHTKLLRVSDRFLAALERPETHSESYVTVSVDSGSAESYNKVHGIESTKDIYARVIENIARLTRARDRSHAKFDVTANYLVTRVNNDTALVEKAIRDLTTAGVQVVRFSFPQLPRGSEVEEGTIVPTRAEIGEYYRRLKPVIDAHAGGSTRVMILDVDGERQFRQRRTLPCFARFLYPAIAYDGYLSNCSQSAAPHFRAMALGNLATTDFWDAFYDYDVGDLKAFLERQHATMNATDCRCDRKEHTVNSGLADVARRRLGF